MQPLYVILAIPGIAVLLLIVAVLNAVRIKAKPAKHESAISYTPEEEQKYAQMLSEMVKCKTVSEPEGSTNLGEFDKLQDVMKKHCPLIFEKLEKTDIENNLLFYWKGKDSTKEPLLLMGHQDVVPAAETTWERDPFSGEIADGKIHGRGAMDCKCTVCSEMAAVEELLAEGYVPERDLYLAFSKNEEITGGGVNRIIDHLDKQGIRLAVAMDEGGAIVSDVLPGMTTLTAAVGICEKGTAQIKFTAKGNGGHSSTPPTKTPIARLSAFVVDAEKHNPFKKELTEPVKVMFRNIAPYLTFPMRLLLGNLWLFKPLLMVAMPAISPTAKALLQTSYCFTMSGGSEAPNVIPEEAFVIANIRPSIQQDLDECFAILSKIAAKYDIKAEILYGSSASDVVDTRSEELAYVGECVKACFPDHCFAPYMQTGGTDCREFQVITDNCLRFTPVYMSNEQLASMHAANENINSDALAMGVKFYKYWIKNHR